MARDAQPADPPVRTAKFGYGGQAVLEGVMMRGRTHMAVACRAPDQSIVYTSQALPRSIYGGGIQKIPFLRGITLLWDTLGLGMKALMFSADVQMQGEAEKAAAESSSDSNGRDGAGGAAEMRPAASLSGPSLNKPLQWTSVAISLVFGIGLFFVTPLALVGLGEALLGGTHTIWSNVAEGVIRLFLLIGYMWLIGLIPDIRRVYMYHGAEHMTIHAFEHNEDLVPENVGKYPPEHPRCGTAFLLEIVAISIILFALIHTPDLWLRILSRIVLVPVIAGIAYELLRLGGKYPKSPIMLAIVGPGLLLQKLTTRQPDRSQMEVAIASMNELLKREAEPVASSTPAPAVAPVS